MTNSLHPASPDLTSGSKVTSGGISINPPPPTHHWPLAQSRGQSGLHGFSNVGARLNLRVEPRGDRVEAAVTSAPPDWRHVRVGEVLQMRQRSTMRWVESHSGVVSTVEDPTGRAGLWVVDAVDGTTSIRHLETATFLGSEPDSEAQATTAASSASTAPSWTFERQGARTSTVQRSTDGRFLDAHESGNHRVVTRPAQGNDSQVFEAIVVGGVYTLELDSRDGRFLDAHVSGTFGAVTRPAQDNDTQQWAIVELKAEEFWPLVTIQQVSTGRYLTALPDTTNPFGPKSVGIRSAAANQRQVWSQSSPNPPPDPVQ